MTYFKNEQNRLVEAIVELTRISDILAARGEDEECNLQMVSHLIDEKRVALKMHEELSEHLGIDLLPSYDLIVSHDRPAP